MCVHSQIQAQEIEVGDLVWVHENDEIPCDLVLLGTSEPMGVCYVEVSYNVVVQKFCQVSCMFGN